MPKKRRKTDSDEEAAKSDSAKSDEKSEAASKTSSESTSPQTSSPEAATPSTSQASTSGREVRKLGSKSKRSARPEVPLLEQVLQNIDKVTVRKTGK